jgi:HK97 family phage major capsid protein
MVADLFMQAQTESPTVRYMREASYTNAADWTTEGDEKPEASFDLEEVDASVRKAAVWSKVTDETLEDFSDIRPYIDQRLTFMLRTKIDSDLLNGTGTAPQIAGLLGTSGIQTSEMSSNTAVKFAEAIMHAITLVRSVGFFEPDAIVMHPNDYEKLRLATDGNTQYYGGGFFLGQYGNQYSDPGRLWGLRIVQTTAISEIDLATPAAGNKGPIVGAFNLGAAVYYRNGLAIEATNTDQDDFIMNLTTIRVEQRLALAVFRPKAFCRVINAA